MGLSVQCEIHEKTVPQILKKRGSTLLSLQRQAQPEAKRARKSNGEKQ
jgi:hypothetical protein